MPRPIVPRQTLHIDSITGHSYLVDANGSRLGDMSVEDFTGGGLGLRGRNLTDLENGRIVTPIGGRAPLQLTTTDSGHIAIFNATGFNRLDARGSRTGMVGVNGTAYIELANGDTHLVDVPFASVTRLGTSTVMRDVGGRNPQREHIVYTGESETQLQNRLGSDYRYATKDELIVGGFYAYIRRNYDRLFNAIAAGGGIEGIIDPSDSDSKMAYMLAQLMVENAGVMTSYLWSSSQ